MKTATFVLVALVAFAPATLTAQSAEATLRGVVADTAGRPIAYARVTIVGTKDTVLTSTDGHYRFSNVLSGRYTVRAHALGYLRGELASVVVVPGKVAAADFRLRRITCDIDCNPVIVPVPPKPPRKGMRPKTHLKLTACVDQE